MGERQGMDVLVLGAGISGLWAALSLARLGKQVCMWEAGPGAGGLASGFRPGGQPAERFYHYVCASDSALRHEATALGLELQWRACGLASWDGASAPQGLASLGDLMALRRPWLEKASLAWGLWRCGSQGDDPALEAVEARGWLSQAGTQASAAQLLPLLDKKFGAKTPVSAAWLGQRLRRASAGAGGLRRPRYALFKGGYAAFFDALLNAARSAGVEVHFQRPASSLRRKSGLWQLRGPGGARARAKAVVAALPAPALTRLLPRPGQDREVQNWTSKLKSLRYRRLVQPVFLLAEPALEYFWVNVLEASSPFCAAVQMDRLAGPCLAYVPAYVEAGGAVDGWSDARAKREALALLEKISGRRIKPLQAWVFRAPFAQPQVPPNFAQARPAPSSPWPGLFHLDAAHLYPEDRSLDACLRLVDNLLPQMEAAS